MVTKLWIVGQYRWDSKKEKYDERWEVQGVFDSKAKAVKACKNPAYFVGPIKLNKEYPAKHVDWNIVYPIKKWRKR